MIRYGIFALLLSLGILQTQAQSPEYRQISDLQDLPCNEIYNIYFDEKGYLWMGTEIGVFRYDGQKYTSISAQKSGSQPLTGITQVNEKLYVFNFLGNIFEIQGDSLIDIPVPKWVLNRNYALLSQGFDDELWVSSHNGVFSYNPANGKWSDRRPEGLGSENFAYSKSLKFDDNKLWFNTSSEVFSITKDSIKKYPVSFREQDDKNLSRYILANGEADTWLCHIVEGSLYYKTGEKFSPYEDQILLKTLRGRKFTNMKEHNGYLYFMAYDGLIRHNLKSKKTERLFHDLPITDMEIDPEGSFWFSTLGYGLLYCPSLQIRSFPSNRMGGSTYKFTYLTNDGNGGIYYSRLSGGIGWVKAGSKEMIEIEGPMQADISALVRTKSGRIYTAFNNDIYEVKEDKLDRLDYSFPSTKDLYINRNTLYIASSSGLFYSNAFHDLKELKQIVSSWCRRLSPALEKDHIWVAASDGLYEVKDGRVLRHLFKNQGVEDILLVPEEEQLYCTLISGEIYTIKNGKATLFHSKFPESLLIYRMKWNAGKLWLASTKGLIKIDLSNKHETWFSTRDGLSANVIYDLHFLKDRLWLATGNGLQCLPVDLAKNTRTPLLYLLNLEINDSKPNTVEKEIISTDELKIDFSVISYYSQGKYIISYSYDDSVWNKLQEGQHTMQLTNLPKGAQGIHIRAMDSKGQYSNSIRIPINVFPPYWQRSWFYVSLVVITFGIMLFMFQIYLRQVRRKQENKLERAELKTNLIESQLTALKAQMNPHFIFNSLNSIYELIIFSETKEAATYLNKFAVLLRKVLENSEKESIPLTEECEWLELYLELEKLRFGTDFSYQISMDSVSDPMNTEVPTMLLQPFVENAVKHGLLHKQGIKRIEIEFSENNDTLKSVIRDNGIGRARATKIKAARPKNHTSFATGAINRRIEMLNSSGKYEIYLEIEDLEFPDGKAAGTEVRLYIEE